MKIALHGIVSSIRKIISGSSLATRSKRLRLRETLALGERRFVALVQVDGQEFLVGGAANSVALLAQISPPRAAGENRKLEEVPCA